MIILELFLKILIGIGSPVVKSLKKIKKIKLPKIIFPKIKWPKIRIKKEKNKVKVKPLFWLLSLFLTIIVGSTILFYLIILKDLPKVDLIYNPPNLSTVITDRNNKILYKFYENENRTWKTLEQIPQDLIEATIAIEDKITPAIDVPLF